MSTGLVAFFVMMTMLLTFYAAFAPDNPNGMRTANRPLQSSDSSLFDKWVRPVVRNFIPQAPLALTEYARQNDAITSLLARSGNPWRITADEYMVLRFLGLIFGICLGIFAGVTNYISLPPLIVGILGGMTGFLLPRSFLGSAWNKRRMDLERTLPEIMDLLHVCMDAGYNFGNALQESVTLLPAGVTKTEFSRVLAEMRAGRTVVQSMTGLAHRCPTVGIESFVRTISQAQATGTDIAMTLESQSQEARAEYERLVDVKAAKIQTTLFMPILALLLPALAILMFAPSMAGLTTAFN